MSTSSAVVHPTRESAKDMPGGRFYAAAELATWVAGLNLLMVAFTIAGGVIFGLGPAVIAAVTLGRIRLRGDQQGLIRTFARLWWSQFRPANAVMLPFIGVLALLAFNLQIVTGALNVAVWVAIGFVGVTAMCAAAMYANYDLPVRRYALQSVRYVLHDVPTAALVAATTALAVVITAFVPGLLPVLTLGAWTYAATGLWLSSFARNDRILDVDSDAASH